MRITNNFSNPYNPKFGMSVIGTEQAIDYMNRNLDKNQIENVNKIIADQQGKKPNIFLHTGTFQRSNGSKMPYLRATVKDRLFKEGLFTSPYDVIKKSAEYVNSLIKKTKV